MAVGNQANAASINQQLTNFATQMRSVMDAVSDLSTEINSQGDGLAALEAIGFGSASNPANPGSISDAQYALNMLGYLNTVAQVYFGEAAQPSAFNFNNALSVLWAGQ